MKKKFVKLFESYLQRYTNGGFLAGDLVKFVDNVEKDEWFKTQPKEILDKIKSLLASDLNLKVANVKSKGVARQGANNTDYHGTDYNVDIMQEIAPGKWIDPVTVPAKLLVRIDTYPGLAPIPNSLKYDNKVQIKPKEVKSEDNEKAEFFKPTPKVDHAYVGNKLQKSETELLNKNVKIPSVTPKGAKDPAVGTARYLPKEKK